MKTLRLTTAQALVRHLAAQRTRVDGEELPLFAGVFAIFGHGNVAGLGEALAAARDVLPTYRSHNEQSMAHTAIAFAKASRRRRMMACTTSIGPGATNLVTAAATAHVDRLPVLLLPGDVFATRRPDPVLQQLEDERDPAASVNDCLRPVSRLWDRITHPAQLLEALPAALDVLTDPARCGPVTLCLPQDVQTFAHDFPARFFEPREHVPRRPAPDPLELARAAEILASSERPLIVVGGGAHYAGALEVLADFASRHAVPVAETQAGKSALPWAHPSSVGGIGVTGTSAANALAAEADVIFAIGTRLSDFTTASRSLFAPSARLLHLNASAYDARKHGGVPLVCDAQVGLSELGARLSGWRAPAAWSGHALRLRERWEREAEEAIARRGALPTDAQVVAAVNDASGPDDVVVCAAGGLPGELHKLWRPRGPGDYHVEYGFSCMGYEIAGGLGVKLARPGANVVVLVGDGSYLMLNTAIAESIAWGLALIVVVLDNSGFGCIHRLQRACGGETFANLSRDGAASDEARIDLAAHAAALGARSERVSDVDGLRGALERARASSRTHVVVIETDPDASSGIGGAWWDVAVPEVSEREEVRQARRSYEEALARVRS